MLKPTARQRPSASVSGNMVSEALSSVFASRSQAHASSCSTSSSSSQFIHHQQQQQQQMPEQQNHNAHGNARYQMTPEDMFLGSGNFSRAGLGEFSAAAAAAPASTSASPPFFNSTSSSSSTSARHAVEEEHDSLLVRDALEELDGGSSFDSDDIIPEIAAALSQQATKNSGNSSNNEAIAELVARITERQRKQKLEEQKQQEQKRQQQQKQSVSSDSAASAAFSFDVFSHVRHATATTTSSTSSTDTRVSNTPAYFLGALPFFRGHLAQLAEAHRLVSAAGNQLRLVPNAGCLGRQELRFLEAGVGRKLQELCERSFAPNRDLLMLTSCSSAAVEAVFSASSSSSGGGGGGDLSAFANAEARMVEALRREEKYLLDHGLPLRLDLQRGLIECSLLHATASLFLQLEKIACVPRCTALVGALMATCRVLCKDGKKLAVVMDKKRGMYSAMAPSGGGGGASQRREQQTQQLRARREQQQQQLGSSSNSSATGAHAVEAALMKSEPMHAGDRSPLRQAQQSAARQGLNRHRPDVMEANNNNNNNNNNKSNTTTTSCCSSSSSAAAISSSRSATSVSSSALLFLDGTPTRKSSPTDEKARARAAAAAAAAAANGGDSEHVARHESSSASASPSSRRSGSNGRRHMFAPGMMPRFVRRLGAADNFNDVLLALRDVAPALDSGSHFVPLDALTTFSSKYSCFVEDHSNNNMNSNSNRDSRGGGADLGRRIIKRLASMQTTAVHHHVELMEAAPRAHRSGAVPPRASSNMSDVGSTPIITNPRAASESSIVIADLLLRHCDAPTLAMQLLNESRPIFDFFLNQQQQQSPTAAASSASTKNSNSNTNNTLLEDPAVLAATRRRIAGIRIRAACAQQPPNWRVGLENIESLLEATPPSSSTTDCLVSDLRPLVALLEVIPPHSMRPSQWLEFAQKFFPPPPQQQQQQESTMMQQQQQQEAAAAVEQEGDSTVGAVLEEFDVEAEEAELQRLEMEEEREAMRKAAEARRRAAAAATGEGAPATTMLHGILSQKQQHAPVVVEEPVEEVVAAAAEAEKPAPAPAPVTKPLQQQQQQAQHHPLFIPTFAALCRNIVRSAEVFTARNYQNQQNQQQQPQESLDSITRTLTAFVSLYRGHLVHVPHATLTLLLALVNGMQVRRTIQEPTPLQRSAVAGVSSLLGPLLRAVKKTEDDNDQQNHQQDKQPQLRVTQNSTRSLSICISSFISKCNTAGLWHEAMSLISDEARSVRAVADARTWSVVAHAAHRPRPSNWAAALTAASLAFEGGSSGAPRSDLDDVTEAATGALRALAHSDIAYSQRSALALKLFARTRALRMEEDESGATKRMLAATVDALSMRIPTVKESGAAAAAGVGATWTQATELFNSLVRSRAVDVTSASRWLRGTPFAATTADAQAAQHREAERLWRGKFCGRGRLGDEQRLSSSLIRALSENSCRPGAATHHEECFTTALMLCGGDASALLRACAQTGAWACALTGLMHLCQSGGQENNLAAKNNDEYPSETVLGKIKNTKESLLPGSPAELRRWIDDAALACVWAPNAAAYLAVRRAFPAAMLPPLLEHHHQQQQQVVASSSVPSTLPQQQHQHHQQSATTSAASSATMGPRSPRGGNMPATYTARDDEPNADAQHYPPIAAINEVLALPHNERHRSRMRGGGRGRGDAMLKQVAPFETHEIVNLTEKIFLRQQRAEAEGKGKELK